MPTRISILVAWGCLAAWSSVAFAQARATGSSGGTSSGASQVTPTQSQTFNSNASSSATGGSAGTASQGGGTTSRSGSTQNRMNTANQPQFNAGDGSVGARIGQNAFVGQGDTMFAGTRDVSQLANRDFSPQFNAMNDPSTSQRRANSTSGNVKRARPQQRISFEYPKANLVRTQVELSRRFERLKTVSGADTSISDEGVAVLTGTVVNDEARKLAEALARLEPGVRSVDNQLQVSPATP
ncbi:MAG: BON domain-containing protein [Planctomycetaceae bacterium]